MAKIKREETRKIQQARRLLEKNMNECDDKNRELDSKIKATSLFIVGRDSVSALETALEASDQENRTLRDRVKVLEASLKDMLSSGVPPSSLKGRRTDWRPQKAQNKAALLPGRLGNNIKLLANPIF